MTLTPSTKNEEKLARESKQEREEQAVALYDFLYRDSSRLDSYYAQIFSGKLTQLEEQDSDKTIKEQDAKLNIAIAGGGVKGVTEIQSSAKRIIDPHDLITTDVLSHLMENALVHTDLKKAPHSSLVLANGTLIFADRYMLEVGIKAIEIGGIIKRKPKTDEEKAQAIGMRFLKEFFSKFEMPSAFLLQQNDRTQVAGTIKESGMEEPISTYYFKHGTAGLSNVYMIGIKEIPSPGFALSEMQLLGAAQGAAQTLSDLMFPPEAIRVTPIALFRKL